MSRPKPPALPPRATASSTDDFAADLATLDAGDDFGADLAALDATPEKSDGSGALATGGVLAGLAGAVPLIQRGAEHLATSPALGSLVKRFAPAAGALNVGSSAWDVISGRKSVGQAVKDGAIGEGVRQVAKRAPALLQRAAAPVAGMSVPLVAGGLAGVAGTTAFLGALQHDANRHVDIDYSKRTPDTDIATVFMDMLQSEANKGKTRDARMDDPNDVLFHADDTATVTPAGPPPPPSRLTQALQALLGGSR